jgi:hypothetical protein
VALDDERRGRGAIAGVAIVYGLMLFLQLYPRIDFMHVVISMASALVVAAGVLFRAERWWVSELSASRAGGVNAAGDAAALLTASRSLARRLRLCAILPIVAVLAMRSVPMLNARFTLTPIPGLRATTSLGQRTMPIVIERDRDHDLRELRAVAGFVSRASRPGEPIVTFPALAMISFLTGRRTPVPHDYFFAGRPDHADETAMVRAIERMHPPLVVTLNDRLGYFSASPAYYFVLRDYVLRNYVLVRRFGRFDVLMRRDRTNDDPELARPVVAGGRLSPAFARGRYRRIVERARHVAANGGLADLPRFRRGLADVDRAVRQASILAIVAVAARAPGGLAAAAEVVARDRRSRLLLLRGIGEFGDQQSLPYLVAVYRTSPVRVQREAATAINFVLARRLASRFTLAERAAGPLWTFGPELATDWLADRIDDPVDRYPMGPLAALAMAKAGRRDRLDRLEALFGDRRADTWLRMTAATALVTLGEHRHIETLFATLNHGTLAEQYVPSMMLDAEIIPHADTVACLANRIGRGTPAERETAAWMTPFSGSDEVSAAARKAATDDELPAVRQAAEWAARFST